MKQRTTYQRWYDITLRINRTVAAIERAGGVRVLSEDWTPQERRNFTKQIDACAAELSALTFDLNREYREMNGDEWREMLKDKSETVN